MAKVIRIEKKDSLTEWQALYYATAAIDKSISPIVMTMMLVKDGVVSCCDGFRYHSSKTRVSLEDGLYSIQKRRKTFIDVKKESLDMSNFPLIDYVLLSCQGESTIVSTDNVFENLDLTISIVSAMLSDSYSGKFINCACLGDALMFAGCVTGKRLFAESGRIVLFRVETDIGISYISPVNFPIELLKKEC